MSIRALCIAALLAACAPAAAAAQEDDEFCPEGRTQFEMNACAAEELNAADSVLNVAYQDLLREIEPERVELLRAAQRAWIRYRDAECDLEASEVGSGSLEPMVHALCLAGLSRRRAAELVKMMPEGGAETAGARTAASRDRERADA